jgi:hypothetical protein
MTEYDYVIAAIDDIPKTRGELRQLVMIWRMLDGKSVEMPHFEEYFQKAIGEGLAVIDSDGYITEPCDDFSEENFIEVDGVVKHKTIEVERPT